MNYWLLKSEPSCYGIDDLKRDKITYWSGVRNYQARNMLRDHIQVGDLAFFYHSNAEPPGIAGVVEIVKAGYPDFTAFDSTDEHYDPASTPENPRWYMVDVKFKQKFSTLLPLEVLRQMPKLSAMQLLKPGNRLSVMPVTKQEWNAILHSIAI